MPYCSTGGDGVAVFMIAILIYSVCLSRLHICVLLQSHEPRITLRLFALGFIRTVHLSKSPKKPFTRLPLAGLKPAARLLRCVELKRLHVRLSSPDAAQAALLFGVMSGAEALIRASYPGADTSCRAVHGPVPDLQAEGILTLSLGQIMWAALKTGAGYAKRRLLQWTSIPSKIS